MSLILKFESNEDRETFLDLVRREKPDLVGQLVSSPLLPHVLAHTDAKSDEWLRERIGQFGRAFEDVRFETFGRDPEPLAPSVPPGEPSGRTTLFAPYRTITRITPLS